MTPKPLLAGVALLLLAGFAAPPLLKMGKQPDGSHIVSTGRRIEPASFSFDSRPKDLAMHPGGAFFAVLNQKEVFLADTSGVIAGSKSPLEHAAAHRGALWSPDGTRLYVSVSEGYIQEFALEGKTLKPVRRLKPGDAEDKENARPGGMCITRDGKTLIAAALDRNSVVAFNTVDGKQIKEYPVENLPFEVKLSEDESRIIVSNWGGRKVKDDDESTAASGNTLIVTDPRGAAASGTVSIISRATGAVSTFAAGLHPCALAVKGNTGWVANAASDDITEFDVAAAKPVRTLKLKWNGLNLFGSMPCALQLVGGKMMICCGGDNAVCQLDIASGNIEGFRPAGYFPTALSVSEDGAHAVVLNTKGNGSVRRTDAGEAGNAHDFQGTVSVLDLKADIKEATLKVAANNSWNRNRADLQSDLAVYHGAIKHVLYIIKENRTYDQILGDMPEGNGRASLCMFGEQITPNAHALTRQFALFDNSYVTGTNSADGHQWSTQALANDYLEHFYDGYRTYPDDGDCAMSISAAGCIWDAALKKRKSLRIYGEFADDELAVFTPTVTSWLQVWKDRVAGTHHIQKHIGSRVVGIRPYMHPQYVYWPLLQSDQERADLFIGEYARLSRENKVPNLMVMALPCDHTEGRDPNYPKPQSMVADNDLALGRIVEAVSNSPQWKDTCIFVIEDDAQSGMDHVDGHRTVYMAISPYTKRKFVDSNLNTTLTMLKSIEMMLGLDPMNRFDALTPPLRDCFTNTADLTPYKAVPSRLKLDDMNLPLMGQKGLDKFWTEKSLALDWSGMDRADPVALDQVLQYTMTGKSPVTH